MQVLLTYVWCDWWHVCCWQVPVSDPAVIPRVEAAHATNVNHEHGCTQHMTSTVRGDLQQINNSSSTVSCTWCYL